jgi:hypothetical protein
MKAKEKWIVIYQFSFFKYSPLKSKIKAMTHSHPIVMVL